MDDPRPMQRGWCYFVQPCACAGKFYTAHSQACGRQGTTSSWCGSSEHQPVASSDFFVINPDCRHLQLLPVHDVQPVPVPAAELLYCIPANLMASRLSHWFSSNSSMMSRSVSSALMARRLSTPLVSMIWRMYSSRLGLPFWRMRLQACPTS